MLQNTRGIVLRSVKYGETSLITSVFTESQGVQSYMVQGVRTSKAKTNKAALLQPATLLELVIYQKPQVNLQRIKEYQYAHIYTSLQEDIVKNSIALFSVELLLRLLPEHAQQPELFRFSFEYFKLLDKMEIVSVANFPIYFIIQCGHLMGYEIRGTYSNITPYLSLQDGAYTEHLPPMGPHLQDDEARALSALLSVEDPAKLKDIHMNATARYHIMDWYIAFLHQHTQHLGSIRSLAVLQAVLH